MVYNYLKKYIVLLSSDFINKVMLCKCVDALTTVLRFDHSAPVGMVMPSPLEALTGYYGRMQFGIRGDAWVGGVVGGVVGVVVGDAWVGGVDGDARVGGVDGDARVGDARVGDVVQPHGQPAVCAQRVL